jgi:peroxiredoxin
LFTKGEKMPSDFEVLVNAAEQKCLADWKRGPTRLRWPVMPLQVGDPAPNFTLKDQTERTADLSSLWSEGPALLMFWRHYGCGCGIDRAARLQEEYKKYVALGATVTIIGQGDPLRAEAYAQKYNLPPIRILSDPDFSVYQAYGLLEGKPSQIVFDAPIEFQKRDYSAFEGLAKARREAGRPLVDSPWQLPGEFVIDQNGILRLTYRYNYCEDFPDHRVLLAAIREAIWETDIS